MKTTVPEAPASALSSSISNRRCNMRPNPAVTTDAAPTVTAP